MVRSGSRVPAQAQACAASQRRLEVRLANGQRGLTSLLRDRGVCQAPYQIVLAVLSMNRINPSRLLNSKWTASCPEGRERHFIVTRLIRGEDDAIVGCELEALINRRCYRMEWRELRDSSTWIMGWK